MEEIDKAFAGKKVLVTGAGGLIGFALVRHLLDKTQCEVVGAGRDGRRFESLSGDRRFRFLQYDATGRFEFDGVADVVVHAASPASPDLFVRNPVETILANVQGVAGILEHARGHGSKVVYVSSSEVYGNGATRADGFRESDVGAIDPISLRSSYAAGKLAAEALCAAYASEYGVAVSIARPGHIYGPYASAADRRVSSLWPRMAADGEAIVMKSDGAQRRSYTYSDDCATALMTIALKGAPGEAYNIARPGDGCTIREFAEIVCREANVELKLDFPDAFEASVFNPMNDSRLDSSKLSALGWRARYDVVHGIRETLGFLGCSAGMASRQDARKESVN